MPISLTELRANLYQSIDHLIETGEPIEIERKGHHIKIILAKPQSKLARLIKRPNVIADPKDDLISNDWSKEWEEKDDLS